MRIEYSKGERASNSFFVLSPDEEAKLLAALAEADRGDVVNASKVLEHIPWS
jgi:hypothetical protein